MHLLKIENLFLTIVESSLSRRANGRTGWQWKEWAHWGTTWNGLPNPAFDLGFYGFSWNFKIRIRLLADFQKTRFTFWRIFKIPSPKSFSRIFANRPEGARILSVRMQNPWSEGKFQDQRACLMLKVASKCASKSLLTKWHDIWKS